MTNLNLIAKDRLLNAAIWRRSYNADMLLQVHLKDLYHWRIVRDMHMNYFCLIVLWFIINIQYFIHNVTSAVEDLICKRKVGRNKAWKSNLFYNFQGIKIGMTSSKNAMHKKVYIVDYERNYPLLLQLRKG